MNRFLLFVFSCLCFLGCTGSFTRPELKIIKEGEGIMRLWRIENREDSLFLRQKAASLTPDDLKTDMYRRLKQRMLETVKDTTYPGVGIAAPQVGISRRLIAVQRFDKPGTPFEFYANPRIKYFSDTKSLGPEGCLSIPGVLDSVWRSDEIIITYSAETENKKAGKDENSATNGINVRLGIEYSKEGKMAVDTVRGFTAVIFQHEIDHLDGILFIDRVQK